MISNSPERRVSNVADEGDFEDWGRRPGERRRRRRREKARPRRLRRSNAAEQPSSSDHDAAVMDAATTATPAIAAASTANNNHTAATAAGATPAAPPVAAPPLPPKSTPAPASKLNRAAEDAAEGVEYSAKYRIYLRDYLRRINHKYFSGKSLAGTGKVFDTVTTVDGFTVKESRDPPIKRYLETPGLQEESKGGAAPVAKRHITRKSY